MAACVADALDAMGIKQAHLFGMHTGNKVAAALAADRPDLVDRLILAGQTHSLFPETEKRNEALGPAFSRYKAAEDEPAAGKPLREWLRTKLILDATWWPEPLLTGAAEEEAIAGAEQKAIDFLLGWRSAIPIYHAVFAQDLAGTVARIEAASLVLELTTDKEAPLGLQGERLAKLMPHAVSRTLPITYGGRDGAADRRHRRRDPDLSLRGADRCPLSNLPARSSPAMRWSGSSPARASTPPTGSPSGPTGGSMSRACRARASSRSTSRAARSRSRSGRFAGECDDLLFAPDGDVISTAFIEGAVRRHKADGSATDLATGLPGINSIALTRDGKRLFAGQVFLGEGLWEIDLAGARRRGW